jgi:hypothetical protein
LCALDVAPVTRRTKWPDRVNNADLEAHGIGGPDGSSTRWLHQAANPERSKPSVTSSTTGTVRWISAT